MMRADAHFKEELEASAGGGGALEPYLSLGFLAKDRENGTDLNRDRDFKLPGEGCGTSKECENTVTICGKCFTSGTLDDIAFGYVSSRAVSLITAAFWAHAAAAVKGLRKALGFEFPDLRGDTQGAGFAWMAGSRIREDFPETWANPGALSTSDRDKICGMILDFAPVLNQNRNCAPCDEPYAGS
jgi:hypothetical protein